ncbi:hypothetical protein [Natrinema gelatinilyticum]|uniref:hypothetical protein n=1 Tax=Natrinema gelatinilyticum TaxID=2961571 RepID=UPI0020C2B7D0|nr:hypothetical protein [Natrinema gelatinilyticum]
MSSRTPEECIDLALNESATAETRREAISELKMANECDELERLVRRESLDDRYRQQTLKALATPQCHSTLRGLVDEGALKEPLREDATELLETVEDD